MCLCFEKRFFQYKTFHKSQNPSGIGAGGPFLLESFLSHMPKSSCFSQMRFWKHFRGKERKHFPFGPLAWSLLFLGNFAV